MSTPPVSTTLNSYKDDRLHEDAQIKLSHTYNDSINDESYTTNTDAHPDQPLTRRTVESTTRESEPHTLPPQSVKTGWNTNNTTTDTTTQPSAIKYGRRQNQQQTQQYEQYDETLDDNTYNDTQPLNIDNSVVDQYITVQQQQLQGYNELNNNNSTNTVSHSVNNIDISLLLNTIQHNSNVHQTDEYWDHNTLFDSISSIYTVQQQNTDTNTNNTNQSHTSVNSRQPYINSERGTKYNISV